jgi:hypothetical protein
MTRTSGEARRHHLVCIVSCMLFPETGSANCDYRVVTLDYLGSQSTNIKASGAKARCCQLILSSDGWPAEHNVVTDVGSHSLGDVWTLCSDDVKGFYSDFSLNLRERFDICLTF